MMQADLWIGYFFFSFGAGESGFLDYFCCEFTTGGGVCDLVAFGKASLNKVLGTLPRYLPLMYLLTTAPVLLFSSMIVSSE
jgi:hypothetical protein